MALGLGHWGLGYFTVYTPGTPDFNNYVLHKLNKALPDRFPLDSKETTLEAKIITEFTTKIGDTKLNGHEFGNKFREFLMKLGVTALAKEVRVTDTITSEEQANILNELPEPILAALGDFCIDSELEFNDEVILAKHWLELETKPNKIYSYFTNYLLTKSIETFEATSNLKSDNTLPTLTLEDLGGINESDDHDLEIVQYEGFYTGFAGALYDYDLSKMPVSERL